MMSEARLGKVVTDARYANYKDYKGLRWRQLPVEFTVKQPTVVAVSASERLVTRRTVTRSVALL